MKNLIFGVLFFSTSAFGQEFNFDIHNTSLSEYLEMEEKLGSQSIPTTSNHVSFSGNAQPIKYQREERIIPDLIVYYYFKAKDSAMSHILFEWDVRHFRSQEDRYQKESEELEQALIAKYKSLKKTISNEFGEPIIKRNYSNISRLDSINTFVESSTWNPNDSTEIEMYATVSNYYEKRGASIIGPVHRIRLYIRNQSKEKEKEKEVPKLDNEKIAKLEQIKTDFFHALEVKDLAKSKEFLSELILKRVTDEQIISLIENIDFEKETELIYSGIQMGFNGNMYTLLQYKYSDDKSSPPSEMIKLTFDDNDKIVGVQPVKMTSKNTDK